MHTLELRIPPVALACVFAAAMALLASAVPAGMDVPGSRVLAVAMALAGLAVALAGVLAFRRHGTTVNPLTPGESSALVATGIYRHSRNPMYLGFLLVLAGWCVFLSNWASALLLPLFVAWMNRFQIQPEERALLQRFGPRFEEYCNSVRRWL